DTSHFEAYCRGYDYALIIALRVLQAAGDAHQATQRTLRRMRHAEALARCERRDRLRLLLTRACAKWDVDRRRFCGAPACWVMVDGSNRPIEFRCDAHRTPESHALAALVGAVDLVDGEWLLELETGDLAMKKNRRSER